MKALKACDISMPFVCSMVWAGLEATGDARVRHCSQCSKAVHRVTTQAKYRTARRLGQCVCWVLGDAAP
ncbi:hypothetical protein QFZ42_000818 [Variovorax paradoxus]|uniref:hypothetical protein n=1 Tax=Variovorax paradoxus TaxID=34073 RepID=UPI0027944888|nr:hypothetical protein [Variovorax paradoxus]MDQ0568984.1 hypothetical protein [Variovorax paradoxus]